MENSGNLGPSNPRRSCISSFTRPKFARSTSLKNVMQGVQITASRKRLYERRAIP